MFTSKVHEMLARLKANRTSKDESVPEGQHPLQPWTILPRKFFHSLL